MKGLEIFLLLMSSTLKCKVDALGTLGSCPSGVSVANGDLQCALGSCTLICDVGYIEQGKKVFSCDGDNIDTEAKCVQTAVFLVGGSESNGGFGLKTVEIYSSDSTLRNRAVADFPYPVESPVALWVDGQVLVCGGLNRDTDSHERRCWKYSACSDTWTGSWSMITPRSGAVGLVTYDGMPWMLGGEDTDSTLTKASEWWTETEGGFKWSTGPDLEGRKEGHCAVSVLSAIRDGIITGGQDSYKIVENFDLETGEHVFSSELIHPRMWHACATFIDSSGDETIMIVGGQNEQRIPVNTVELGDPVLNEWREDSVNGILPDPRTGLTLHVIDGKPTALGGQTILSYNDAYAYDIHLHQFQPLAAKLKEPRAFAGSTPIPATIFDHC